MLVIASFPRSGNHLVRFMVEYLTGRPTLGCATNPVDVPICRNTFPDDPDVLAHVGGEPIARKVHFVREIAPMDPPASRLLLVRRDPTEALLSHVEHRR
ncbi:MAG TPA: hypothetical protein VMP03_07730 [Methylomirabilota bacterium]|nr:hypothetical protein [Methylomirabilota bacterium]